MNNCRDCKHWTLDAEQYQYYDPELPENEWGEQNGETPHKVCGLIGLIDLRANPAGMRAFTQDASGYSAKLWTAPDFGCALWASREAPACCQANRDGLTCDC
jgi:hypothetical protein